MSLIIHTSLIFCYTAMEDVTCIGENRSDGVESLETCGFETASHGAIVPPAVGMGISNENGSGAMVNSQPLCHLPLMRSNTPVRLTPPPTTPVMRVYNSHYPMGSSNSMPFAADEATNSELQHNGNFLYSSSSLAPTLVPIQVDAISSMTPSSGANLQPYTCSSVNSPMFVLNPRFPVCSIPTMNGDTTYSGAMYGNRYSNVPFGTSVPAVTIPPQLSGLSSRNFPLLQATFFSIHGPPNPYLPQDNVAAPIACNSSGSFHPNGYPLSLHTQQASDHICSLRPPYSFSALIAMSIQSSPKKMATLPEIYEFITAKFPFYKQGDKKWKNSIRHNLSLNKCFKKAPRKDGLHGKGNYWIIDPACDHVLENGNFRSQARKRKRNLKSSNIGAENHYNHDDGNRKVESDESLAMCQAGSILNPNMSAAEIVIPPINSSGHNGVAENPYFTPDIQAGSVAVQFKTVGSNDRKNDLTILTPGLAREQQNMRSTGELPFYTQRDIAIVENHAYSQNHAMQQHASHVTRNGEISCGAGAPLDHLKFGVEKLLS